MKISILLPTRNRLDYLRYAIETVLRQDSPEWELVVSDNASSEDIAGYVSALADARVKYVRSESFLPVTENWNRALAHSSGDYVLMLGDDDGLLPGYVNHLHALVERFDRPDVVYTSALLFTYPEVVSEEPAGFLMPYGYASFLQGAKEPFRLNATTARAMVDAALDLRLTYGYNSQFLAISRRLIDELRPHGAFYQSPFPDYYSTNVAFLKARGIVVEPQPQVLIGVTPKSYGFFHANQREDEGRAFLEAGAGDPAAASLEDVLLPGTNINVGWLLAMEAIRRDYGAEFGLRVNRRRFRRLQAAYVYEQRFIHGTVTAEQLDELERRLTRRERLLYRGAAVLTSRLAPLIPARPRRALHYLYRRALRQYPTWNPARVPGRYATLLDAFEDLGGERSGPRPSPTEAAQAQGAPGRR